MNEEEESNEKEKDHLFFPLDYTRLELNNNFSLKKFHLQSFTRHQFCYLHNTNAKSQAPIYYHFSQRRSKYLKCVLSKNFKGKTIQEELRFQEKQEGVQMQLSGAKVDLVLIPNIKKIIQENQETT